MSDSAKQVSGLWQRDHGTDQNQQINTANQRHVRRRERQSRLPSSCFRVFANSFPLSRHSSLSTSPSVHCYVQDSGIRRQVTYVVNSVSWSCAPTSISTTLIVILARLLDDHNSN